MRLALGRGERQPHAARDQGVLPALRGRPLVLRPLAVRLRPPVDDRAPVGGGERRGRDRPGLAFVLAADGDELARADQRLDLVGEVGREADEPRPARRVGEDEALGLALGSRDEALDGAGDGRQGVRVLAGHSRFSSGLSRRAAGAGGAPSGRREAGEAGRRRPAGRRSGRSCGPRSRCRAGCSGRAAGGDVFPGASRSASRSACGRRQAQLGAVVEQRPVGLAARPVQHRLDAALGRELGRARRLVGPRLPGGGGGPLSTTVAPVASLVTERAETSGSRSAFRPRTVTASPGRTGVDQLGAEVRRQVDLGTVAEDQAVDVAARGERVAGERGLGGRQAGSGRRLARGRSPRAGRGCGSLGRGWPPARAAAATTLPSSRVRRGCLRIGCRPFKTTSAFLSCPGQAGRRQGKGSSGIWY